MITPSLTLDFETKDMYIGLGLDSGWCYPDTEFRVLSCAYKVDNNPEVFLDLRDPDNVIHLREIVQECDELVAHELKYELGCLKWLSISVSHMKLYDTKLAAKLYDNLELSFSLSRLVSKHLNSKKASDSLGSAAAAAGIYPKKTSDQKKLNKWAITNMDLMMDHCFDTVKYYNIIDTAETYKLSKFYDGKDIERSQVHYFCEVIRLITNKRERGVRVDIKRAKEISIEMENMSFDLHKQINDLAGFEVNLHKSDDKAEALIKYGVTPPRTPKTNKYSVKADFLKSLDGIEIATLMVECSSIDKIRHDFIDKVIDSQEYTCPVLDQGRYGRVFPAFLALQAITGRFSCRGPNIQQIPKRHKVLGPMCRSIYVAEEGTRWFSLDYSNQEGRLAVHYANQFGAAADYVKAFNDNPNLDLHQKIADDIGISRSQGKTINHGLTYGMGIAKLARSLGMSEDDAKELKERFLNGAPYVRSLMEIVSSLLKSRGYIKTLLGRKLRLETAGVSKYGREDTKEYKGLNALMQGGGGDMVIKAMLDCDSAGLDVLFSVHDELEILGTPADAAKAARIMEKGFDLAVPIVVSYNPKGGNNWDEAK